MTSDPTKRPRVIVAEPFAEAGIAVLQANGFETVILTRPSRDALKSALRDAAALIVRSGTRVDAGLLEAAPNLVAVGRAGVGVDTIDVEAATAAGIAVLNAPDANTIAVAEYTFAVILALLRRLPEAANAARAGVWDRAALMGSELFGKTLGVVGLGRIGTAVAERAKAFGMRICASDPFASASRAESLGIALVPLQELLRSADIVTLHAPHTEQTRGMIGGAELAQLRPEALLVNCARGNLIDERALLDRLDRHAVRGAALDVFGEEPPPPDSASARLRAHPRVLATSHIAGSTLEALDRVAIQLAGDLVAVLRGRPPSFAVNVPQGDGADAGVIRPYIDLAYRLGLLFSQLQAATALPELTMTLEGLIAALPSTGMEAAFLAALFSATTDRRVTVVNAKSIADELGVRINVRRDPANGALSSSLRIAGDGTSVAGTCSPAGLRICGIDGYEVDAAPSGAFLLTQHRDVPGMVGKVGTILGDASINISAMQVSRNRISGDAIMLLSLERAVPPAIARELRAVTGIAMVRALELPPQ
jgi:D-3-phosphoglycerate dehydrogenase